MADDKKPKSEENIQKPDHELGKSPGASTCDFRRVLCHRFCLYLFPACALIASLILVTLAFKTPRPGVSLGFSFLLLILAIFYCVVGNVVKCWLPQSNHEGRDSESDKYETRLSVVVVSSAEELPVGENV